MLKLFSMVFTLCVVAAGVVGIQYLPVTFQAQIPEILLSETSDHHVIDLRLARDFFADVRDGKSTDPSMAIRMVKNFMGNTISYEEIGTTKEEFLALMDRYGLQRSRSILQAARAGTYTGHDVGLRMARSDLEDFGFQLADIGFTEDEFDALLKKYDGPSPKNAAEMQVELKAQ